MCQNSPKWICRFKFFSSYPLFSVLTLPLPLPFPLVIPIDPLSFPPLPSLKRGSGGITPGKILNLQMHVGEFRHILTLNSTLSGTRFRTKNFVKLVCLVNRRRLNECDTTAPSYVDRFSRKEDK